MRLPLSGETSLTALNTSVFIYMDGPNSQTAGVAPSTWSASVQSVITCVKSASPAADFLLMPPPENQRGLATKIADYATLARALTLTNYIAFNDLQEAFGSATNPSEYGSTGTVPLFNADNLHPEPTTGGRAIVAAVTEILMPTREVS
jgi:hypothetical protein